MSDSAAHMLEIRGLSVGYPPAGALLEDLDLTVERNEMVALIGRNGAGKSTLLRTLLGLHSPLSGDPALSGKAVSEYDPRSRARMVSFVTSQATGLASLSATELVSLGRIPHTGWGGRLGPGDRKKIREALRSVGMESFADRKVEQLSDGERQRVMIARALAQDTPLMVLDEPTAFLDIPHTFELILSLSRFRDSGKSILFSTHDLEMAITFADKIWLIDRPRVYEGAPEDLGRSGLFHTLFRMDRAEFDEEQLRFVYRNESRGRYRLRGTAERELRWTRHLMKRLGYRENGEEHTELEITVGTSGGPWMVRRGEELFEFPDLYGMARFLTRYE